VEKEGLGGATLHAPIEKTELLLLRDRGRGKTTRTAAERGHQILRPLLQRIRAETVGEQGSRMT